MCFVGEFNSGKMSFFTLIIRFILVRYIVMISK